MAKKTLSYLFGRDAGESGWGEVAVGISQPIVVHGQYLTKVFN